MPIILTCCGSAYYSPIFAGLQQKEISGFLTQLWSEDPLKAKWSILAKAYSVIRDVKGKKNAPLDSFLAINGPYIGVIAPSEYFDTLGWILQVINEQVSFTRRSTFTMTGLDNDLLTTNLSVDDVIAHSVANNYIYAPGYYHLNTTMAMPVLTMATSSQGLVQNFNTNSEMALTTVSMRQNDTISTVVGPSVEGRTMSK